MHQVIERQAKTTSEEFLKPASVVGSSWVPLPGFDGERPLLSFVLKVLAGDRKMVRLNLLSLLEFEPQFRISEGHETMLFLRERPPALNDAVNRIVETMRLAADMWVDSGKTPSGNPADPPHDDPSARNVAVVLPGRSFSLFDLIQRGLLIYFSQGLQMRADGTVGIRKSFPRFDLGGLNLADALHQYAGQVALWYFVELLQSPDARRIARCDGCHSHFAYQRARLRTVKRGVFCPNCKSEASMNRTQASRRNRLDTAAKAWVDLESLPRKQRESEKDWDRRRREKVADQVHEAHGTDFGRRWVSQHLSEIQGRAEALRNAKGKTA